MTERPNLPFPDQCSMRLSTIFDNGKLVLICKPHYTDHIAWPTPKVNRNNRSCFFCQYLSDLFRTYVSTVSVNIGKDGPCTCNDNRWHGGDEGARRHYNFVTGWDAERGKSKVECYRTIVHRYRIFRIYPISKFPLKWAANGAGPIVNLIGS